MHVVVPELLADMRSLPAAALAALLLVGGWLWSAGWWTHRFWVVLAATFGAGLIGLRIGPDFGVQPVVAGLLAAVAGGCLALSLVRVVVFILCGLACWYAARLIAPHWTVPLVCLLTGGLIGVLLFRFWVIVLSSALGTLCLAYGGLVLCERLVSMFDVVQWAGARYQWVNGGYVVVLLLGVLVQYWVERGRKRLQKWRSERKAKNKPAPQAASAAEAAPNKKGWWARLRQAA
jgi:hypothetical protein